MRLLVFVNVFAPDRGGAAGVYSDMCYELAQRYRFDVTVCAPYPYFPEWKDKSGRNGFSVWKYRENGINVRRYGMYIPKKSASLLPRLLCEISILLSMMRAVPLARRVDAIMVYCPHACYLLHGWLIKTLFRKPVWLNVQDLTGDAAAATGMSRGLLRHMLDALRKVEAALIRSYDVCSTLSPAMRERLEIIRGPKRPVHIVANWADPEIINCLATIPVPESVIQRRSGSAPMKVHLLYVGNVSGKQNLLEFCRYLAGSKADFHFRIFAAGGRSREVLEWIKASGDSRFEFGPFLSPNEYARELRAADFYVITEKDNIGSAFFPSKAVVGMTAGVPILSICDRASPLGRELVEHPVGPNFSWDRLSEVEILLRELNSRKDLGRLDRWHHAALARSRIYDRNLIISNVRDILLNMVPPEITDAAVRRAGAE
jgi:hypothetical protein